MYLTAVGRRHRRGREPRRRRTIHRIRGRSARGSAVPRRLHRGLHPRRVRLRPRPPVPAQRHRAVHQDGPRQPRHDVLRHPRAARPRVRRHRHAAAPPPTSASSCSAASTPTTTCPTARRRSTTASSTSPPTAPSSGGSPRRRPSQLVIREVYNDWSAQRGTFAIARTDTEGTAPPPLTKELIEKRYAVAGKQLVQRVKTWLQFPQWFYTDAPANTMVAPRLTPGGLATQYSSAGQFDLRRGPGARSSRCPSPTRPTSASSSAASGTSRWTTSTTRRR